ncbi:uncharacterized protein SCHCODRAFT_02602661 [Schizophyllum commune H4-8]|uniref:uncharacterized protein n=1 Tax=Schizophyllum commune (strain H4-8 / FGSC 9210) TaxID=578458 RepID=UPI0021609D2D|nr:uncharacterized protein SCHCODRAFT_02602661 [Schizophyllum commune H4-8]KAI5886938.1 hypothetical protein SCHCODRAFT_02602661 [Schizophyllum commune H4-8]
MPKWHVLSADAANIQAEAVVNYCLVDIDAGRYQRQMEHFEYYWGLGKGELALDTELNHIQLRKDMADKLDCQEWAIMPTQDTLDAMISLSRYNASQDVNARRHYSEILPEVEYEYEFVPLYVCQPIYAKTGRSTRTFRPPYARMPRLKSRAHPLFVIFKMVDVLILFISTSDSKERAYTCSAIDVAKCWEATPPPEFLIGSDVWQSHRHPLSDDGSKVQDQLKGGKRTHKQPRNVRKSTRAPCSLPKAHTGPSIYDRQQRPIKEMTSALPLYRLSGRTESSSGLSEQELHDWMERARGQASAPPDSTADDRLLAEYQKERARDPDNALRLRNVYDLGGVITGPRGSDRSRYSSNDWAMHVFNTCLWTHKPPPNYGLDSKRPWL